MQRCLDEPARRTPIYASTQVLVAGGGLSGVAAAVAAARAGARAILLEREGCLGGVACATLMANIGNRYMLCNGTQAVHGLAAEVVERLVAVGAASPNWRRHKAIAIDSEKLKVILIELLREAGVETLTHSMAGDPILEEGAVRGAFFESKSGRQAVLADNTVDCTGEADLAWRAGVPMRHHRFSCSLLFKLTGVQVDELIAFMAQDPEGWPAGMDWAGDLAECERFWKEDGVFFFPHFGGQKWRQLQQIMDRAGYGEWRLDQHGRRRWWGMAENIEAFGMYTHRRDGAVVINTGYYCWDDVEIGELSRSELEAQRFCYYAADFLINNVPGFEHARVEHIGVALGLRGGRSLIGHSQLRRADFLDSQIDTHKDDVIATAPIRAGVPAGVPGGLGSTCDIPFGSCVPHNCGRLLVGSGKSVDTEGGHTALYRGMSGCMVYGQAAGACAALAARAGIPAGELPVRELQRELLRQGQRLGDERRLRELGLTIAGGVSEATSQETQ